MKAAEPVFVTGGSGLLGTALVKRLVSDGRSVRALGRSEGSRVKLQDMGAHPVAGDIGSVDLMADCMAGCASVFHLAGVNAFCVRDLDEMLRVNVMGSRNVVTAAARAGVSRVVYTSSATALGEPKGTIGNETSPHRGYFLSNYERSKYEGEMLAMRRAEELGVDVVRVNPSSVQGPGRASGTGKILVLYLNGKLKFFVRTTISLVDIDDCTEGHLLAERNGAPGERYVLNSSTVTIHEALAIVARITGMARKPRLLPGPIAAAAAAAVERVARLRGAVPPVCREMVRTLLHGHHYDGSKAVRSLGLRYTPIEVTLQRTVEWLRAEALVP